MYKLCFYVPDSHLEAVKQAVFQAGGGRIGNYDQCCWQVLGEGQFRALAGSDPFVGALDHLQRLPEWKVELVVADDAIRAVIAALKQAHPYETPAFETLRLESLD
ncbi:YqfO family protein [Pseudomonas sp.]|jgi:hypothetical protein|uniref:YqfO family protein n=1 Tax=Pseudomonas sp. TaxID=306 RepID=UPI0028ACB006|nr:YqfO family protein [Pseudomonas sp.]